MAVVSEGALGCCPIVTLDVGGVMPALAWARIWCVRGGAVVGAVVWARRAEPRALCAAA